MGLHGRIVAYDGSCGAAVVASMVNCQLFTNIVGKMWNKTNVKDYILVNKKNNNNKKKKKKKQTR